MTSTVEIGSQRGWQAGDLIALELVGTLTTADVSALKAAAGELVAAQGRGFLLADSTRMTGIEAEGAASHVG